MQVIQVSNSLQDLCNKLHSAAVPDFFDNVELSENVVICTKNGETVLTIDYQGIVQSYFSGNATSYQWYRSVPYYDFIDLIIVTEKAIYLKNSYGQGACLLVAKDTAGDLVFVTRIYEGMIEAFGSGQNNIDVFRENGDRISRMYYLNDDTVNKKSFFIPLLVDDDLFVDDVYVGLIRPFPENTGYIAFTIGSTGYVGFGGTSLIVKTT